MAQAVSELRPLVAAVGLEFYRKWAEAEQQTHQEHTTVAVLNVTGMSHCAQ